MPFLQKISCKRAWYSIKRTKLSIDDLVLQQLGLWELDQQVPGPIPDKINLGNEVFNIGSLVGVVGPGA